MHKIARSNRFKKDYKKILKRGKDKSKLYNIIQKLSQGEKLDTKYKDHILVGVYKGRRECHIEPDWLLIYKLEKDTIILERTGSHSDLFE